VGVIVEYKRRNIIKVIDLTTINGITAGSGGSCRTSTGRASSTRCMSVRKEPIRADDWWCKRPADTKCWKNQRHARRNWMRHLHRLRYPSIHGIMDRCEDPDIVFYLEDFAEWYN